MRGAAVVILSLAGVLVFADLDLRAEEETLPVLRRKLLEAHADKPETIGYVLDKLSGHIGPGDFFESHGAFGDWLATIPDGRADHPVVRLRRGWAYVRAQRGKEAVPHLEAALADDPADGLRRAYLGEALRQSGRFEEAAAMLITSAEVGYKADHLDESFRSTVFGIRSGQLAGHADGLPDYIRTIQAWLEVRPSADWHFSLALWLLTDMAIFEKPDRDRGKVWAETAGIHALRALDLDATKFQGSVKLAYDAAVALEVLDTEREGRTARFELLAWVYRLGAIPSEDSHRYPQAITWLAEAAAREGRFALAFRLATRRMEISWSPRARRLLMKLPPDLQQD